MSEDRAAPVIRILKIGTCPNLSGKSELGYHISHSQESGICFRVVSNSGGGFFSAEYVSFDSINKAIEEAPKPITSCALAGLFRGKSVNTPSFLFAALLAEGLVQRDEGENPRAYVALPADAFVAEMQKLIDAGTDLKVSSIAVVPIKASKSKPSKSGKG